MVVGPGVIEAAWRDVLDLWMDWLRSASKPETTLYLREYQMRRFAADHASLDPLALTLDQIASWLGAFDWAVETRRSYRAAIRSFYHWAHITGKVLADPAALLPTITPPITYPRPAPEAVFRHALSSAPDRVLLMLELGGFCGLRRAEIAQVSTVDLEQDLDGWSLRVHGKGRRDRPVPLLPGLAVQLRKMPSGYLFPGQISGHLSPSYVGKLMSAALPEGWTAHSLRHRFSAKFYENERDIRATQEVLGHASVVTTQRYTPVPSGTLRRAIQSVA